MPVDFDELVLGRIFDALARPVTLVDLDSNTVEARGLFSRRPLTSDMGDAAFVAHISTLGLRASELPAIPAEGWQVMIGSATYRIPQPPTMDGEGRIEVMLQAI